jgi:hypothetical protein
MELEDIMLTEVSQVQKGKGFMFSLMWKIDPKDKHIYKTKYHSTHIYVESMFGTVELLYGTWERMKGKENESQQYQNTLHLCRSMA